MWLSLFAIQAYSALDLQRIFATLEEKGRQMHNYNKVKELAFSGSSDLPIAFFHFDI
jgi:hypothetical protein